MSRDKRAFKSKEVIWNLIVLFSTLKLLEEAVPSPVVGDWAIVGDTIPGPIYECKIKGAWSPTGTTGGGGSVDLNGYLTAEEIDDVTSIL